MTYRFDEIADKAGFIAKLPADGSTLRRRFVCERCDRELTTSVCVCDKCAQVQLVERRAAALARARNSIPDTFRGVRLAQLAKPVGKASSELIRGAFDALRGETPTVTLTGPTRAGKTTIACAMLNEVIAAGAEMGCEQKTLDRARFAHFGDAVDLAMQRKEHRLGNGTPGDLLRAKNASVLVIDEFGREDRSDMDVAKLIHQRHRECRLTIVTTWMDRAGVAKAYDGGTATRLFTNSILFELGGAKS